MQHLFCSLTGILEGDVGQSLDVGIIGEIVEQVANTLIAVRQPDEFEGM